MPKTAVLSVSVIEENPGALRTSVDRDTAAYEELKDSIRQYGLLSPVSVREYTKDDGSTGYRLVDGLHRLTAHQDLGLDTIPVNITSLQDSDLLAAQIVGNSVNVKTTKVQFAQGLKQLLQHSGMTTKELGRKVSKSETWVKQQLDLTNLPESIQKLVDSDAVPVANALALKSLPKDKIEDYIQAAMTESPETFGPRMTDIARELRAAAREGRKAVLEFAPVVKVRKTTELKAALGEFERTGTVSAIRSILDLEGVTDPTVAAAVALKWVLSLDAVSVSAQKATWEAQQAAKDEAKAKRAAEREAKAAAKAAEAVAEVVA